MAITHYEPWRSLNQLQKELEGFRDDKSDEGAIATAERVPAADIKKEADKFVVLAACLLQSKK